MEKGPPNSPTLVLQVVDTGRGIHSEDLLHIFDRYFQTKRADVPIEGGSGIGLALSREYAHLFGGELTVESELGKGSMFTFVLPRKEVKGGRSLHAKEWEQAVPDVELAGCPV